MDNDIFLASCHLFSFYFLAIIESNTSDFKVFYNWLLMYLHTLPVKHNCDETACYVLRAGEEKQKFRQLFISLIKVQGENY